MDPTEVRQMVKHQQCVVVIDTSPPIKSGYPPYAVLKQRAIATEYGEPKLVELGGRGNRVSESYEGFG